MEAQQAIMQSLMAAQTESGENVRAAFQAALDAPVTYERVGA